MQTKITKKCRYPYQRAKIGHMAYQELLSFYRHNLLLNFFVDKEIFFLKLYKKEQYYFFVALNFIIWK